MSGRSAESACNRFVEKCEPRSNGCIEWIAATTPNGYGVFWIGTRRTGQMQIAHRWLFEQAYGMQPADIDVCHTCDNRRCVNIDHMFAGTRKENMEDAKRKGRLGGPRKSKGQSEKRFAELMERWRARTAEAIQTEISRKEIS
jgi:HNH endonuclease